ncbi:hydrophobin-3 precursor [Phlebopus sp. FC_14]|nr:hydrophobin-3 precursor [Phlebopus sp. FC_14]
MFVRFLTVASLAALAVAGPVHARDQCNTGAINCCNSVQQASTVNSIFGLLGMPDVLTGVTGLVGTGCTPITVVGTGSGAECEQQPVCCTGNKMNGLINIGCTPINLNA